MNGVPYHISDTWYFGYSRYDGEPDQKNNHGIFQSLSKEMALSVIMKAMVGFLSQEMIVILTTGVNQGF